MSRVLHAGFHKTGSTFLQIEFFPKLRNVVFAKPLQLGTLPIFDAKTMSVVFSNEAACGYPYPNTHRFNTKRIESSIDLLSIDKLIIVEREFYSWVLSIYYQTLNERYSWTLEEFISENRTNLLTWRAASEKIEKMCIQKGIGCLIVPYEKLTLDQLGVLNEISNFIDGSSFDVEAINLSKRSNTSRYGNFTISTYRILNMAFNNHFGRLIEKFVRNSPRRIVNSRLGMGLEKLSRHDLSVEDVRRIMQ